MAALAREAMRDGALGMTTGLAYIPGSYAKNEEIVRLARVVAKHGGLYASHIRNQTESITLVLRPNFMPGNPSRTVDNTAAVMTEFLAVRAIRVRHPALLRFWERSARRAAAMDFIARRLPGQAWHDTQGALWEEFGGWSRPAGSS